MLPVYLVFAILISGSLGQTFEAHDCSIAPHHEQKTVDTSNTTINIQAFLFHKYGPGYRFTPAKCLAIKVQRVDYPNCTLEIPVRRVWGRGDITLFVNSVTQIIQYIPTIVVCSHSAAVQWKINDTWVCSDYVRGNYTGHSCVPPVMDLDSDKDEGFDWVITDPGVQPDPDQQEASNQMMTELWTRLKHVVNLPNGSEQSLGFSAIHPYLDVALKVMSFIFSVWAAMCYIFRFKEEFESRGWNGGRSLIRAIFPYPAPRAQGMNGGIDVGSNMKNIIQRV